MATQLQSPGPHTRQSSRNAAPKQSLGSNMQRAEIGNVRSTRFHTLVAAPPKEGRLPRGQREGQGASTLWAGSFPKGTGP